MEVAKDAALPGLEIVDVVDEAEDGLQAEETDENDSQTGVRLVKELKRHDGQHPSLF